MWRRYEKAAEAADVVRANHLTTPILEFCMHSGANAGALAGADVLALNLVD